MWYTGVHVRELMRTFKVLDEHSCMCTVISSGAVLQLGMELGLELGIELGLELGIELGLHYETATFSG